jgi:hypothetical protein
VPAPKNRQSGASIDGYFEPSHVATICRRSKSIALSRGNIILKALTTDGVLISAKVILSLLNFIFLLIFLILEGAISVPALFRRSSRFWSGT